MSDLATVVHTLAQVAASAEAATTTAAQAVSFSPLGAGIAFGIAAGGAGIGIGLTAAAALSGMARQPEQGNALKGTMILGIAFIEGLALIAMVFALVVVFLK